MTTDDSKLHYLPIRGAVTVVRPRCYVIAQSYVRFARFCKDYKIDPKDKDVICVVPDHDWRRQLRGVSREYVYFVFLADWDEMINIAGTERRDEILGTINSITMTQNPSYLRTHGK